jgi:hypothetical protein
MPLADTRILHRHGGYDVLAQRGELLWRDGSAVHLHRVHHAGVVHLYLRAVAEAGRVIVFDLRDIYAELGDDLARGHTRDHHGLIYYTARHRSVCAAAFMALATRAARCAWHTADDEPAPQAGLFRAAA